MRPTSFGEEIEGTTVVPSETTPFHEETEGVSFGEVETASSSWEEAGGRRSARVLALFLQSTTETQTAEIQRENIMGNEMNVCAVTLTPLTSSAPSAPYSGGGVPVVSPCPSAP